MSQPEIKVTSIDPIWDRVRDEAEALVREEPRMSSLIYSAILNHSSLESVLGGRIAMKLASPEMPETVLRDVARDAFADDPEVGAAARADILAVLDRDPACHRMVQPILYFKGFRSNLDSQRIPDDRISSGGVYRGICKIS